MLFGLILFSCDGGVNGLFSDRARLLRSVTLLFVRAFREDSAVRLEVELLLLFVRVVREDSAARLEVA